MSSFELKKVALVVLVAFGAGSSLAQTVDKDFTIQSGASVSYGALTINNGTFTNNGNVDAESVDVTNGTFVNAGEFFVEQNFSDSTGRFSNSGSLITVGQLTLSGWNTLGGSIEAADGIVLNLTGYEKRVADGLVLSAPNLNIVDASGNYQAGVVFAKQSQVEGVDLVTVISHGSKTALEVESDSSLSFKTIHLQHDLGANNEARVEVLARGHIDIENLTVAGKKGMIQTNSGASANIANIRVGEGSVLNLQTNGSGGAEDTTGEFTVSNIFVEKRGDFRISVYTVGTSSTPDAKVNADNLTLTLESGAIADFGGWKEEGNTDWDPDRIFLTANNITVNVLDTENLPSVYLSGIPGNTNVGSLSVVATGSNNSGNAAADLQKLSGVVKTNTKTADDGSNESVSVTAETIKDITLTQEANDIYDGATASVDETGAVTAIQSTGNVNIDGIAGIASTGFLLWRDEMTSLNRRLDDLRDSSAHDNGLWVRAYNSRSEYGARNITSKYTAIQVGYDRQISNQFWLGGAFSYTDGDHEVAQGSADNSLAAFTLYGTWMNDSGLFVDVTGKYGRIDNDFDINLGSDQGVSSGDYDTNAWGLSVQAGWRWQPNMFFVEPQVELMYGRMSSVDYTTSTGLIVDHDAVDSLIGRAGFSIGVDYPDNLGRIYLRASVLHDWKGEADYTFTKGAISRYETDDLSGTWYEVGVGANFNVTENLHIIGDLQTSHGGEVDTDYRVNLVARYSF